MEHLQVEIAFALARFDFISADRRAACTDAAGHALQLHLDPSRSQNEIFM